jgi:A/G-specific adenine glycosylase
MDPSRRYAFQAALLDWYEHDHRPLPWRETRDPYKIWISEVMLQQTRVKTVLPYYRKFLERFPEIGTLAAARLEEVLKLWEGLGYYSRARNLHHAARQIMAQFNGHIPDTLESFVQLTGVGPYIGAAVQSIAFNRPHAAVDGNVKRVLARLMKNERPINVASSLREYQKAADRLLVKNDPGRFNQAMMELGAMLCRPRIPECYACPISSFCKSFDNECQHEYPKRVRKPAVATRQIAVAVIVRNGRMLITRRKPEGLLGGLWEFPGGKIEKGETGRQACIREIREEVNLEIKIISRLARIRHAYTHFKINMEVFHCAYLSGDVSLNSAIDYCWVTVDELPLYPFPKANHKFMNLLREL